MACFIEREGDLLIAKTGRTSDFKDTLARLKSVPGKRWNPDRKVWEYPLDYATLQRLIHVVRPELGPEATTWLAAEKEANETALSTTIPEDGAVSVPWGDKMYPHQRAAVEFMRDHPKCIVADDMGLGKTLEGITAAVESAYLDSNNLNPHALVICPNSVTHNWEEEILEWVKSEGVTQQVHVIDARSKQKREKQYALSVKKPGWTIVNWEKLRIMPQLADEKWDAIIADEAHRAKNRKAQQTKALWKIGTGAGKRPVCDVRLALTGTPVQNEPSELWSILKWLYPEDYTSYWKFFELYVDYYEGQFGKVITGVKHPEALRFELANKLIRRTKAEVLDLPEKTRTFFNVPLHPKQQKMYDEALTQMWVDIELAAKEGDSEAQKFLEHPERLLLQNGASRTVRLRQIASTPATLGAEDDSSKLDAACEIINDAPKDKQFVVFTAFKTTVAQMNERLERLKITSVGYTGDTPVERTKATEDGPRTRQEIVESFQRGETRVIIGTIAAMGVGVTLTNADTVIFIERDWVPANNEQAEDRLHRIGQRNAVQVVILQGSDTVDTLNVLPTNRAKELIVKEVIAQEEIKHVFND